jgi:hypothetical protein
MKETARQGLAHLAPPTQNPLRSQLRDLARAWLPANKKKDSQCCYLHPLTGGPWTTSSRPPKLPGNKCYRAFQHTINSTFDLDQTCEFGSIWLCCERQNWVSILCESPMYRVLSVSVSFLLPGSLARAWHLGQVRRDLARAWVGESEAWRCTAHLASPTNAPLLSVLSPHADVPRE